MESLQDIVNNFIMAFDTKFNNNFTPELTQHEPKTLAKMLVNYAITLSQEILESYPDYEVHFDEDLPVITLEQYFNAIVYDYQIAVNGLVNRGLLKGNSHHEFIKRAKSAMGLTLREINRDGVLVAKSKSSMSDQPARLTPLDVITSQNDYYGITKQSDHGNGRRDFLFEGVNSSRLVSTQAANKLLTYMLRFEANTSLEFDTIIEQGQGINHYVLTQGLVGLKNHLQRYSQQLALDVDYDNRKVALVQS